MSATDELRRLLDERGVKWESKDVEGVPDFHDTRWNAYDVQWCYVEFVGNNYTKLNPSSEFHCTPEQAIAATLSGGGCEMEKLERWDGSQPSFRCKECGHENYEDDIPNYCPRCGKAVKR